MNSFLRRFRIFAFAGAAALACLHHQAALSQGVWVTNTVTAPDPDYSFTYAAVNGVIYVAGGYSCGSTSPTTTVQAYNTTNHTWTTVASLPIAVEITASGVISNILYVVGGSFSCGVYNYLQAYNPALNSWTTHTAMPTARSGLGVAVVGNILYAIGGQSWSCGLNPTILSTVEAYNPGTDSWTAKSSLPVAVLNPTVTTVNGIIYVIGGINSSGTIVGLVQSYNPATDTWSTSCAPIPTPEYSASAGVINGVIYVTGGAGTVAEQSTTEAYNPVANMWTFVAPMPDGLQIADPGGATINGTFYVVPSQDRNNCSSPRIVAAFTPGSIETINMYAGLTIAGQIGSTDEVDYLNELTSNWMPLATFVLSNSPTLFIDTNSTFYSHRFYRAITVP